MHLSSSCSERSRCKSQSSCQSTQVSCTSSKTGREAETSTSSAVAAVPSAVARLLLIILFPNSRAELVLSTSASTLLRTPY